MLKRHDPNSKFDADAFGAGERVSTVFVGMVGGYFALCGRHAARKSLYPAHPDPDVQAPVDERIDISEYRRRKEVGDLSYPSFKRTPDGAA